MNRKEVYELICNVAERDYADIMQRVDFNDESARIYFRPTPFICDRDTIHDILNLEGTGTRALLRATLSLSEKCVKFYI